MKILYHGNAICHSSQFATISILHYDITLVPANLRFHISSCTISMEQNTSGSNPAEGIVINQQDVHMSQLKPVASKKLKGYKSPGGDSTSYLIETPKNPVNPGESKQKPLATSEIMPLLEAQHRKESKKKVQSVMTNCLKVPALLVLLYVFICSLDLLSNSFRLMAGKAAGKNVIVIYCL